MNSSSQQLRLKALLMIKKIVTMDKDGDRFIIANRSKNIKFLREYSLFPQDIKHIILSLSIYDCFSGPEYDKDNRYTGFIYKYSPTYEGVKLYIKIRIENENKAVCISIHKYGEYN